MGLPLRTMTSYELEDNIPSSTSCHRHQEDLFQSVSKPVLPVLTALLIFEGQCNQQPLQINGSLQ